MDANISYIASSSWDEHMGDRMRWLRENDPVFWSEKDELWVISRHADVVAVSKNQDLFSSAHGVRPENPVKIGLIDEAEPRHTELRRLINKGFTPRMVRKLEVAFRGITAETIDAVADIGECDFVEAIAVPLPLLVIAEMIGIRPEDRERFHHWSDAMIAAEGNSDNPKIMEDAGVAFMEYSAYVTEILEDRRENPQDDLVSILLGAESEGLLTEFETSELPGEAVAEDQLQLANNELIMLMVILLVAGNETTRNAISGGMQLLIENPEERAKLLADPSLLNSAVEEMLRMVSPVHSFSRTVMADTELHGRQLKEGQKVLMLYPSANRDAEVYDDPDTFKVDRNPEHLAFGIGGHFCLGANLARMEMRVTFEQLLKRLPDMEYAGDGPEIKPSALVRSCMRMDVRYTPENAPTRASM